MTLDVAMREIRAELQTEIRRGAYYDSVVLMQLQRALARLDGVAAAGAVMGVPANKELLAQGDLLSPEAAAAGADDLIIVVRGESAAAASAALAAVDELLNRRRAVTVDAAYRPKTLASAVQSDPDAAWVLISTPGRYAAGVARDALDLGRHVFLYSDNVSLDDEVKLKTQAAARGLLVMGPDCGTALVGGVGLGFANVVRQGNIGLVGASGTGLQLVTARIHQLGAGITHALGTGGRDLSSAVGAITTRQSLDLLLRDPQTAVVVLISKPPAPDVAAQLVQMARTSLKPVVINFVGQSVVTPQQGQLYFTRMLDETAELAVRLATQSHLQDDDGHVYHTYGGDSATGFAPGQRYLRGLYAGGTLAYEAQLILQDYLPAVYANAPLVKQYRLENPTRSQGHTVVDLGEDEFTVGRLHPMMDNELRLRRLAQEAADPETALILLDLVLGYGAHPDPALELAPAIAAVKQQAAAQGRHLEVVVAVVGTEDDPQDLDRQIALLVEAGATVKTHHAEAVAYAGALVRGLAPASALPPVDVATLHAPLHALNVGLESFAESLTAQGAPVTMVEWRPPAGGNERLMGILARMKQPKQ